MIVEGNTPARNKHVLRNVLAPTHPAWFVLDADADPIAILPILFKKEELRHWWPLRRFPESVMFRRKILLDFLVRPLYNVRH